MKQSSSMVILFPPKEDLDQCKELQQYITTDITIQQGSEQKLVNSDLLTAQPILQDLAESSMSLQESSKSLEKSTNSLLSSTRTMGSYCQYCNQTTNGGYKLECGDLYHDDCFVTMITKQFIENQKLVQLKCLCNTIISTSAILFLFQTKEAFGRHVYNKLLHNQLCQIRQENVNRFINCDCRLGPCEYFYDSSNNDPTLPSYCPLCLSYWQQNQLQSQQLQQAQLLQSQPEILQSKQQLLQQPQLLQPQQPSQPQQQQQQPSQPQQQQY